MQGESCRSRCDIQCKMKERRAEMVENVSPKGRMLVFVDLEAVPLQL